MTITDKIAPIHPGEVLLKDFIEGFGITQNKVAVAIGVGRVGSMVSPMLVGRLLDAGWQKNQLYFGAAIVLLLAMAAVAGLKQRV